MAVTAGWLHVRATVITADVCSYGGQCGSRWVCRRMVDALLLGFVFRGLDFLKVTLRSGTCYSGPCQLFLRASLHAGSISRWLADAGRLGSGSW